MSFKQVIVEKQGRTDEALHALYKDDAIHSIQIKLILDGKDVSELTELSVNEPDKDGIIRLHGTFYAVKLPAGTCDLSIQLQGKDTKKDAIVSARRRANNANKQKK